MKDVDCHRQQPSRQCKLPEKTELLAAGHRRVGPCRIEASITPRRCMSLDDCDSAGACTVGRVDR